MNGIQTKLAEDTDNKNWLKFYSKNYYYHSHIHRLTRDLVPSDASLVEFGCRGGELLKSLPNKNKTGVEYREGMLRLAKSKNPKGSFVGITDLIKPPPKSRRYDYILFSHTSYDIPDVQSLIQLCQRLAHKDTRIIVYTFNFLWRPILVLAELLGLKLPSQKEPAWLTGEDLDNMFYLESFERIKSGKSFLMPFNIPVLSVILNKYIAQLPFINSLCLANYYIYKSTDTLKDLSVSIVIPARNEAGNMKGVLKTIPRFAKKMEVVFVEGHSSDNTYATIQDEIDRHKGRIKASLYKQKGKGKGDAVRLGFAKAKNDLLMILDADLTVDPKELPKFYKAILLGKGDLVMGSRLIYPMEKQAMRDLNYLGNKFFGLAFSFLLGQRIKDTLCGTKVILKKHYVNIAKNRKFFGDFDPFGDFDLIFGAAKLNLKIIEIPVRYKERIYGTTNISRFSHGLLLLRMVAFAARKLKFV